MEEQLEGLKARFVELEKMLLGRSSSPTSTKVDESNQAAATTLAPADAMVDAATATAEEEKQVEQKMTPDVTPLQSPSATQSQQDSRIGNGTHATGMHSLICSKTLESSTLQASSDLSRSLPHLPLPRRRLPTSATSTLPASSLPLLLLKPHHSSHSRQQTSRSSSKSSSPTSSLPRLSSHQLARLPTRHRQLYLQQQRRLMKAQARSATTPPHLPSTSSPTNYFYHLPHFQAYLNKFKATSSSPPYR